MRLDKLHDIRLITAAYQLIVLSSSAYGAVSIFQVISIILPNSFDTFLLQIFLAGVAFFLSFSYSSQWFAILEAVRDEDYLILKAKSNSDAIKQPRWSWKTFGIVLIVAIVGIVDAGSRAILLLNNGVNWKSLAVVAVVAAWLLAPIWSAPQMTRLASRQKRLRIALEADDAIQALKSTALKKLTKIREQDIQTISQQEDKTELLNQYGYLLLEGDKVKQEEEVQQKIGNSKPTRQLPAPKTKTLTTEIARRPKRSSQEVSRILNEYKNSKKWPKDITLTENEKTNYRKLLRTGQLSLNSFSIQEEEAEQEDSAQFVEADKNHQQFITNNEAENTRINTDGLQTFNNTSNSEETVTVGEEDEDGNERRFGSVQPF